MTYDKPTRRPLVNLVELVLLLFIVVVASQTIFFGRGFSGFWTIASVGLLFALLSIVACLWSRRGEAIAFGLIAVMIAITISPTVPQMFPLRHDIEPASFINATMAEVLHHVAKSKKDHPSWRFFVSDQDFGYTRISVTIPEGESLRETLSRLMQMTGGSYTWNWHKCCGNEPSPLCASFHISGDGSIDRSEYDLMITENEIYDDAAESLNPEAEEN